MYKKITLGLLLVTIFGFAGSIVRGALDGGSVRSALENREYVWVGNNFEGELKPVSLTGNLSKVLTQKEYAFSFASEKIVKSLFETKRASVSQAKQFYKEAINLGPAAQVLDGNRVLVKTGGAGVAEFEAEKGRYAVQASAINNVGLAIPRSVNINLDEYIIPVGVNSTRQGSIQKVAGDSQDSLVREAAAQEEVSGNSRVKVAVYHDKNVNGRWDSDEEVLPWAGVRVDLINLDKQSGIELSEDWKDVFLDGAKDGMRASDLVNDLSENCPSAGVSTVEGDTRKTFLKREGEVVGNSDFEIAPGRVYSIKGCEVPFYIIGYDLKKQVGE